MGHIEAKLSVNSAPFKQGLEEARQGAKKFKEDLTSEFTGAFAGLLAAGAVIERVKAAIEHFGQVGDLAERFDVSAEALQRLGYAGGQSGLSLEEVAKGVTKLKIAMGAAVQNAGPQREMFEKLGFTMESLKDANPEEVFHKIADAVKNTADPMEQLAIAEAAFGNKLAVSMLPMLKLGSDGLKEMGGEAAVMSDGMVAQLKQADDGIKSFQNTLTVAFGYIAIAFNFGIKVIQAYQNFFGQGMSFVISTAQRAGFVISDILHGHWKEAREGAKAFFSGVAADAENAARDVGKQFAELSEFGDKKLEAKKGTGTLGLLTEEQRKEQEEAAKKALKDQEEYAKARERYDEAVRTSQLEEMSAQEKLNELKAEQNRLEEEAAEAGLHTVEGINKLTEAEKRRQEITREQKKLDEENKRRTDEIAKLDKELQGQADKHAESKMTKEEKVVFLRDKQTQLLSEANAEQDPLKSRQKRLEAGKVTEALDELEKPKKMRVIKGDSLQAVGGGGFASSAGLDPVASRIDRTNNILERIAGHLSQGRDPGSIVRGQGTTHLLNHQ